MRKFVLLAFVVCLTGSAFGQTVPPGGWSGDATLGSATPGQSTCPEKGVYHIEGNGNDIWDNADAGQYLYKELVGDGSMTARVVDNGTGSNSWAKGGTMIRQSTDAGSVHAFTCITGGDGGGSAFQRRLDDGGGSSSNHNLANGPYAPPYWVRIERVGDDFTGYLSEDGENWSQAGDVMTIEMQDPVLIGLAVTSHAAGELRTYIFDSISFTGEVSGEKDPGAASNPSPTDEAVDIPRDSALVWTPGDYPGTHDVYLGTVFDDVNDASRADPMGVLVSQGQSDATYTPPAVLEFGQTYYWRIDEVNNIGGAIFKSDVWSFTVEPFAYVIEGVVASSNAVSDAATGIEKTVDGSGLNAAGQHSTEASDMWLGLPAGDEPITLIYEFDQVYKLDEMVVWNYNVQFEMMLGFGLSNVTAEYSEDGENWTLLGDVELNQATALATYEANTNVAFGGVPAKFVKLTVNDNFGMLTQYGLGEVQFMQVPAHPREPQPEDGATDVSVTTMLSWRAGREAVSHEVSLGTDAEALDLAGTVDVPSLSPGTLDLDTAYFWQVDEVNEADAITTWPGAVWGFTTQAYLVVDDMESYIDDEGGRIYESWVDGYGISSNGSTVGHLESPFAEQTIVQNGKQSMPLSYDNTGTSMSEAELSLNQNWTTSGVKSLAISFQGEVGNTGQLYVKINGTKIAYDGSADDIARAAWQAWNIDLSAVGNVSNVTSLIIGIEGAGAAGIVYIDDVRLYPKAPEYITPVDPGADGLVAYYAFDGDASDGSGNGNHGTLNGDVAFAAGQVGSALDCDGVDDYVSTGKSASDLGIGGNSPRTVSSWVFTRGFANGGIYDVGNRSTGQDFCLRTLDSVENRWRIQYWGGDLDFSYNTANEWVHFTHVHDGAATKIYANGVLIVDWEKTIDTTDDNPFQIGCYGWQNDYFDGLIDEVRVFNRALSAGEALSLAGQTTPRHKAF